MEGEGSEVGEEIRSTAVQILDARRANGSVPVEVSQRFLHWWQLRCYPDAATGVGSKTFDCAKMEGEETAGGQ